MNRETKNERHLEEAYLILRKKLDSISSSFRISPEEAEDLIQDGYLKLKEKEIDNREEARGKLWVTIKNLAIDSFRRKKQTIEISQCEIIYNETDNMDEGNIYIQIKQLLTPLQNRIMTLLIKEDLDYPEIASRLNMKEGAVRTAVSRARKILKEKLER